MPVYGGPDLGITYTFVAVVPFKAEHPIGSGTVVTYNPGDTFPGEEWGNAAHNLVEVGKAVRLAVNVADAGGSQVAVTPPASTEKPADEVNREREELTVTGYPHKGGGGWWTLSDGSRVRGEDEALEAQKALDEGGSE